MKSFAKLTTEFAKEVLLLLLRTELPTKSPAHHKLGKKS